MKTIRINQLQCVDLSTSDYTINPTVELILERKGRGYDDNGRNINVIMPIDELIKIIDCVGRAVCIRKSNATAIFEKLMDTILGGDK